MNDRRIGVRGNHSASQMSISPTWYQDGAKGGRALMVLRHLDQPAEDAVERLGAAEGVLVARVFNRTSGLIFGHY